MKRVKIFAIILSLCLIFILLTACGSGKSSDNTQTTTEGNVSTDGTTGNAQEEPTQKKEPVKITYWHIFQEGEPLYKLTEELMEDFQSKYDYIQVEHVGTNFWDYWAKLQTAIAGGMSPDVGFNGIDDVSLRAEAGTAVCLDDYIKRDGIDMNNFFPGDVEPTIIDGKQYAMPYITGVRVLYWNKEMFREAGLDPEKPPTTLEELEQYADMLTKKNGNRVEVLGFHPRIGNFFFWTLAWPQGGEFWDAERNPTLNTPELVEVAEWWVKMCRKYDAKVLSMINSQAAAFENKPFVARKVAMCVDQNDLYLQIKKYAPDLEFGVAPIPYKEGKRANWSCGFTLELYATEKAKQDAGWELIKYLTDVEPARKIAIASEGLASNRLAMNDPHFMEDPYWKFFIEEANYSRNRILTHGIIWANFVEQRLQEAENGRLTAKEALDKAQEDTLQAIENRRKSQE